VGDGRYGATGRGANAVSRLVFDRQTRQRPLREAVLEPVRGVARAAAHLVEAFAQLVDRRRNRTGQMSGSIFKSSLAILQLRGSS